MAIIRQKRFFRRMFERAKEIGVPYIRVSGATLSEGSWHYQSVWNVGGGRNLYDVDTREWGSATSQGKDLRDVTYSNFFPVSFGANFAIKDTSTVEQYEHVEAIAVGYGATYYLKVNQQDVESCPQKDRIFQAIRTWETPVPPTPSPVTSGRCSGILLITGGWKHWEMAIVGCCTGWKARKNVKIIY